MKWFSLKISEFCKTGSGGTPSTRKKVEYYGGDIPWIKSGELKDDILFSTEETLTRIGLEESSAKLIHPGAILIAMYGATVGRTSLLGIDATTNQAICHIIPDSRVAENKYVWYVFRAKMPELLAKRVGGAQPNISQKIIRDTLLTLPPLTEQRRIVEILDQADTLRKKRAEADAKTEKILPALFYKMFGDPATNPMGWETGKLGDVIANTRNGLYKHAKFYGSGIGILKMFNIQKGELDLSRIDLVNVTEDEYKAYCLKEGDILVNRVNTPELVGKCAVITEELGQSVFESKNIRIRVKINRVTPDFAAMYLNSPFGHGALRNGVKHAIGMATINNSDIRKTNICLPPLKNQKKWSNYVFSLRALRKKNGSTKNTLNVLFKNLLYHAFSGDLTTKWREARMKELISEMKEQAKLLNIKEPE